MEIDIISAFLATMDLFSDLTESVLKRLAGAGDSGRSFPGNVGHLTYSIASSWHCRWGSLEIMGASLGKC
jgi:hypothetical protein